jgi:anti-sigma regulatory factor (Ser/Thr protein kinase)
MKLFGGLGDLLPAAWVLILAASSVVMELTGGCVTSPRLPNLVPDDELQTVVHLQLAPEPAAVRAARRFVLEHAPELPTETEDTLLLLTSELVTNAVIHARTQIDVEFLVGEHHVAVAVFDLNLAIPYQEPYAQREGGWGLGLVSTLAQESSMYVHPEGGKTVWFRLQRGPAPAVADDAAERNE